MLDRAGFSPGVIDGDGDANTRRRSPCSRRRRTRTVAPSMPLTPVPHHPGRRRRPLRRSPDDMMENAKLPALGYSSLLEALAERFHATPALLQQLNPGVTFAADRDPGAERRADGRCRWRAPKDTAEARPQRRQPGTEASRATVRRTRTGRHRSPTSSSRSAKGASALTVTDPRARRVLRPGDDRQRARPAADRRVEGHRRPDESDVPLQPRSVLGCRSVAHEGDDPGRTQQSRRRGLDRHLERPLRAARHAGARSDRPDRVARMRAADQLGCAASSPRWSSPAHASCSRSEDAWPSTTDSGVAHLRHRCRMRLSSPASRSSAVARQRSTAGSRPRRSERRGHRGAVRADDGMADVDTPVLGRDGDEQPVAAPVRCRRTGQRSAPISRPPGPPSRSR